MTPIASSSTDTPSCGDVSDDPVVERVRAALARPGRGSQPAAGWVMRKNRTSPLETRHVTP